MGYDMDIAVLKKKSLEEMKRVVPNYTFKELYSDFLFTRFHPDEYEVPKGEEGRWITWANRNIFRDFFEPVLENEAVVIISEETYNKMVLWLEEKLKSKTLYDIAVDESEELDENTVSEMIRIYKDMKKEKIDYDTEFVVYQHDW